MNGKCKRNEGEVPARGAEKSGEGVTAVDKSGGKAYTERNRRGKAPRFGRQAMEETEIVRRVNEIRAEIAKGNPFGEKVTLVAAVKTRTPEEIDAAVRAGVDAIAENKVQEFREKNDSVLPCPRHFIGHLQLNKVKYLIGKIELYHSCDRDELAEELSRLSVKNGVISRVLIQINIGEEESKGGYPLEGGMDALMRVREMPGLKPAGFMAMLPESDDEKLLGELADKMRRLYEEGRRADPEIRYLSMGMSGDYRLCVAHGSNMIRLGSTIFGPREYAR